MSPGGAPDLVRLRRDRHARLRAELERSGAAALLVSGSGNVKYTTGAWLPAVDAGGLLAHRPFGLVLPDREHPVLWTAWPEGAPEELPRENVRAAIDVESRDGVRAFARELLDAAGGPLHGPVAVDDLSAAMLLALPDALGAEPIDAALVLGPAKLRKTDDEIECIRSAQAINERAMLDVQAALRPGLRQTDLSALFLRRIHELGASGNGIDPIWQVVPARRADGPTTVHGEIAFPAVTDDRFVRDGDVLWVDTGIDYAGYQSDFGRTWIAGRRRPSARQHEQARRWHDVLDAVLEGVRPGANGRELTDRATRAAGGEKPWLRHFYLIHGVGTDPAEMPLVGTDLGEEFDESIVLAPGMVLVLEPVIWDEGHGGFRAEEIVAVTEDGWHRLSDHPYAPFEVER